MSYYVIPVPGRFLPGVALLDLETVKVPAAAPPSEGYRMPNGELLKRRWSVTMAGVARDGEIFLIDGDGREAEALDLLGVAIADVGEVRYSATREFDEMICKGRFTNARRAHLPTRAFPAVRGADRPVWRNVKIPHYAERGADVPSRDVPKALAGGEWDRVAVHLLRDVAELVLAASPSEACETWCRRVLTDYAFALGEIYGRDE